MGRSNTVSTLLPDYRRLRHDRHEQIDEARRDTSPAIHQVCPCNGFHCQLAIAGGLNAFNDHQKLITDVVRQSGKNESKESLLGQQELQDKIQADGWPLPPSTSTGGQGSVEAPFAPWSLRLPEDVLRAPSLLSLTDHELRRRGVYTPRQLSSFDHQRWKSSMSGISAFKPLLSRAFSVASMTAQSALAGFPRHSAIQTRIKKSQRLTQTSRSDSDMIWHSPSNSATLMLVFSLCLVVFMAGTQLSSVAVLIADIDSDFGTSSNMIWYQSAFLLAAAISAPLYGRLYTIRWVKSSILISLLGLAISSILSGFGSQISYLLAGRAIAGFMTSGILLGSVAMLQDVVAEEKHAIASLVVILFAVTGFATAPIIVLSLKHLAIWQWLFYVHLAISTLSFCIITGAYRPHNSLAQSRSLPSSKSTSPSALRHRNHWDVDILGLGLFASASCCLCLALQAPSIEMASNNPVLDATTPFPFRYAPSITASLFTASMLIACLLFLSICVRATKAIVPLHICKNKHVMLATITSTCIGGIVGVLLWNMPIWFRAVRFLSTDAVANNVLTLTIPAGAAYFIVACISFKAKNLKHWSLISALITILLAVATITVSTLMYVKYAPSLTIFQERVLSITGSAILGTILAQTLLRVRIAVDDIDRIMGDSIILSSFFGGAIVFTNTANIIMNRQLAVLTTGIPEVDVQTALEFVFIATSPPASQSLEVLGTIWSKALKPIWLVLIVLSGVVVLASVVGLPWKLIVTLIKQNWQVNRDARASSETLAQEKTVVDTSTPITIYNSSSIPSLTRPSASSIYSFRPSNEAKVTATINPSSPGHTSVNDISLVSDLSPMLPPPASRPSAIYLPKLASSPNFTANHTRTNAISERVPTARPYTYHSGEPVQHPLRMNRWSQRWQTPPQISQQFGFQSQAQKRYSVMSLYSQPGTSRRTSIQAHTIASVQPETWAEKQAKRWSHSQVVPIPSTGPHSHYGSVNQDPSHKHLHTHARHNSTSDSVQHISRGRTRYRSMPLSMPPSTSNTRSGDMEIGLALLREDTPATFITASGALNERDEHIEHDDSSQETRREDDTEKQEEKKKKSMRPRSKGFCRLSGQTELEQFDLERIGTAC